MMRLYIAAALVMALAITAYVRDSAQSETVAPPPPSPFDQEMVALDRQALNDAYRSQMSSLFLVWLKDESGQPTRAISGANRARRAYIGVMREIEKRETRP